MTTTAHTLTETDLTQRALKLKTWVGTTFNDDEDSVEIDTAVSKLAKGRPDPENADDQYLLRVLRRPATPPTHVYTLLALLLLRRRGGPIPNVPSADDEGLLARAVDKLSSLPSDGLHRCMMCFTGLFGGEDMTLSDRLTGVRDAAAALYSIDEDEHAKGVSIEIVQRVSALAGDAREEVSNVLGEVIEKMLQEMVASGNVGSMESALALEKSTSVMPPMDQTRIGSVFARTGLTARQFMWTYRAVEKHVRFMDMAKELGAKIQKTLDELEHHRARHELQEEIEKEYEEFASHVERRVARFLEAPPVPSRERSSLDAPPEPAAALDDGRERGTAAPEATTETGAIVTDGQADEAPSVPNSGIRDPLDDNCESCAITATQSDPVEVMMGDEGMGLAPEVADGKVDAQEVAGTMEAGAAGDEVEVDVVGEDVREDGGEEDHEMLAHEELMELINWAPDLAEDELSKPVPITQEELDDILRERYRWNRSHKKGKDGEDSFGKELAKNSKAHPDWKDAARQARDTWVRLQKEQPEAYCLWKLGDTIGKLVLRYNMEGQSNTSADSVYKNISAFLNSNLTDAEKRKYFGSVQTFRDCSLILKTAWKGVKEALGDAVKNAEYSDKERNVPAWPVLFDLAQTYINETASPLTIETAEHAKLVRRLYGLRVSITEHVPRRREVFKVTPLRLTRIDPSHEDYVDPRKCNYVDDFGVLRLNVYKTADVYGEYALQLTPEAHALIHLLENYAERENQKTLFGNENNLSNLLYDIYEPVLHVRVGCGALRRRYISNAVQEGRLRRQRDQIELSRKMGHSVWMQLFYYAKEEGGGSTEENVQRAGTHAGPSSSSSATDVGDYIVIDSDPEEVVCSPSRSRTKRSANTDGSPPAKKSKTKQYCNALQAAALREIIQREREDGGDGNKIAWNRYVALYPALQDVDGDVIRRWGNTVRAKMDGKKGSPSRVDVGSNEARADGATI